MFKYVLALVGLTVSLSVNAALSIRDLDGNWSNGHEGVYDDVLDITWLADANYAKTIGSNVGFSSGLMEWHDAQNFVDNLTIGGFENWRLPEISCGYNNLYGCSSVNNQAGELYELIINSLGNIEHVEKINPTTFFSYSFLDAFNGQEYTFIGLPPAGQIWYSTPLGGSYGGHWTFTGLRNHNIVSGWAQVWAVHDGDIGASPVPLPAGVYLFISSLVGLGILKTKK